jgi:hypothetical protein
MHCRGIPRASSCENASFDAAKTIEVNVGCMDDPSAFPPEYHIYAKDRISWFDTADDLPRYAESEPGAE